ncbi:MAG: hypothetical protein Fur003_6260 [Candidatus Dojkabacteria bacterium]
MPEFYTRKDISENEIELKVSLPKEAFKSSYEAALKEELSRTNVKGFRKGMVPTDMLEKQIKPVLLTEVFQRVAPYYVNAAIIKENLEPAAPPKYTELGDLDLNKEVTFTVKITLMPKFKLGNLKKIKVTKQDEKVTKEDLEKTLENMQKNNLVHVKGDKVDDKWAKEIAKLYNFPEVKNLDDLKKEIEKIVKVQKKAYIRQSHEAEVLKEAIKLTNIKVPDEAIEYEAHEREHAFMHDLENAKMTMADYEKSQGITHEQMHEAWHKDAQEALETDLLLKTYAEERKVTIEDDELKAEIDKIKVANRGREGDRPELYEDPRWIAQIKSILIKQKAYRDLIVEVIGEYVEEPVESANREVGQAKKKAKSK